MLHNGAVLPDPSQLATLLAIVEEGSFEAAARRLHLTPSAVSQRIRALEASAGRVLVRRTAPASVTEEGQGHLRLARRFHLLEMEFDAAGRESAAATLRIAVNADSLAIWFGAVLAQAAEDGQIAVQVFVEDQAYGRELLRRGEVVAAVTSHHETVQGCSVEPLGTMRYVAAAARGLVDRRGADLAALPLVVFNEKDHLQDGLLERAGLARPPIVHRVPSSHEFAEAVRCGLGWGMVPQTQLSDDLVPLRGGAYVDIPLFWHRWRLELAALDRLSGWVRGAAAVALRQR
ncbi:LysR family transcriptional regulator ArgP [soil metagenome]